MTASEVRKEAAGLLKLGFAFMSSGLMMTGSAYAVRLFLSREAGIEAAGLYQSAWTLGGLYVGIILGAMFADYYPRLAGVATEPTVTNRMVNEQARVSVLLAGPGIIATLTFAPLIISLFYTANFDGAAGILRWICLGTALQVIIGPVGYVILARNEQKLFFWTELAWTVVHLGLAWLCVTSFGADGAGMAFFGAYVFHGLLTYWVVRRINGFRWSTDNKRTGLLFLTLVAAVFGSFYMWPPVVATGVGTLATILSAVYSLRVLLKLIPLDRIRRLRADACP